MILAWGVFSAGTIYVGFYKAGSKEMDLVSFTEN